MECCLLNNNDLFKDFFAFEDIDNLIVSGVLMCSEESVRMGFHDTLQSLARYTQPALGYLLKLLSSKFNLISEYPSRQFFDLFNTLIDMHYKKADSKQEDQQFFNPELLLNQIIKKIKTDN